MVPDWREAGLDATAHPKQGHAESRRQIWSRAGGSAKTSLSSTSSRSCRGRQPPGEASSRIT
eukprot:5791716-Pyramimonas_sp.AAC.1